MTTHHGNYPLGLPPGFRPGEADPRMQAPTQIPGSPETREGNNITRPHGTTRRTLLFGGLAALGVGVVGGGLGLAEVLKPHGGNQQSSQANRNADTGATEKAPGDFDTVRPVFGEELRLDQIVPPASLDAPTFGQIAANVGQYLQYCVNNDRPTGPNTDPNGIDRVIPGGSVGILLPGQFELRAAFIHGYRAYEGTSDMNNPDNPRNYAWGFTIKLLEQTSNVGANPADVNDFSGRIQVVIGDYRPTLAGGTASWHLEKPQAYETDATFTRLSKQDGWTPSYIPDLSGSNSRSGWGIARMDAPEIPSTMTRDLTRGFDSIPPLFSGS